MNVEVSPEAKWRARVVCLGIPSPSRRFRLLCFLAVTESHGAMLSGFPDSTQATKSVRLTLVQELERLHVRPVHLFASTRMGPTQ